MTRFGTSTMPSRVISGRLDFFAVDAGLPVLLVVDLAPAALPARREIRYPSCTTRGKRKKHRPVAITLNRTPRVFSGCTQSGPRATCEHPQPSITFFFSPPPSFRHDADVQECAHARVIVPLVFLFRFSRLRASEPSRLTLWRCFSYPGVNRERSFILRRCFQLRSWRSRRASRAAKKQTAGNKRAPFSSPERLLESSRALLSDFKRLGRDGTRGPACVAGARQRAAVSRRRFLFLSFILPMQHSSRSSACYSRALKFKRCAAAIVSVLGDKERS